MATAAAPVLPSSDETTLRARRLVLENARGEPAITLGPTGEGHGVLLSDGDERPRAQLVVGEEGDVRLKLHDRSGEVCAWLEVGGRGGASLWLRAPGPDARVLGHAGLQVDEHGCASLSLHDGTGRARALLRVDEGGGRPVLQLTDRFGEPRTLLSIEPEVSQTTPRWARPGVVPPLASRPTLPPVAASFPGGTVSLAPGVLGGVESRPDTRGRRWVVGTVLGAFLLAVVGGWVVLSRGPQFNGLGTSLGSVRAHEFVLQGPSGDVHGRLGVLADGSPFLYLLSPDGRGEVELSALRGPQVQIRLASGDGDAVLLATAPRGGPSLGLWQANSPILLAPGNVARFPSSVLAGEGRAVIRPSESSPSE